MKTIAALFYPRLLRTVYAAFVCVIRLLSGLHTLWIVYFSASLMIFVTGLCMLTSSLVVFFRDLSQIINIFLQVGIWMTPIMWSLEDLLAKYPVLAILKLNPLCYIVYGYRGGFIRIRFGSRTGMDACVFLVRDGGGMGTGLSRVPETESTLCGRDVEGELWAAKR